MQLKLANKKEFMIGKKKQLTLKKFEMPARTIEILHKKKKETLESSIEIVCGRIFKVIFFYFYQFNLLSRIIFDLACSAFQVLFYPLFDLQNVHFVPKFAKIKYVHKVRTSFCSHPGCDTMPKLG